MRTINEKIIAIFCADLHLSLSPPIWRSAEPDWMLAQRATLAEITDLQREYNCPVLCAGDIFDRNKRIADGWDAPPELINYAICYLPDNMYAIPGQHDLPDHQYVDIKRSAYWTLVKAGKIKTIKPNFPININNLTVYGFPPNFKISSPKDDTKFNIALVHDYVWYGNHKYPNAPEEAELKGNKSQYHNKRWYGYDIVVFGDNHKGFTVGMGKTTIFNCGTLMRRKSDEINYKPQVGLLTLSGKIIPYYLDISKDKYIELEDGYIEPEEELDMSAFMKELEKLGKTDLDFEDAMKQFLRTGKISREAGQIILDAMEKAAKKK